MARTKSGIELITIERKQQIRKHGFTKKHDQRYVKGELLQAALFALELVGHNFGYTAIKNVWPNGWSERFENSLRAKDDIGKLTIAGAFYMAEQDRIGKQSYYATEIRNIAKRIDELLKNKT